MHFLYLFSELGVPKVIEYPKPALAAGGSDVFFNCSFEEDIDVRWKYPLVSMK